MFLRHGLHLTGPQLVSGRPESDDRRTVIEAAHSKCNVLIETMPEKLKQERIGLISSSISITAGLR